METNPTPKTCDCAAVGEFEKRPEFVIEDCENCGEEGFMKSWFGKGAATGDSWGDAYRPTGSVVLCKECFAKTGKIGDEWSGEKIWKTTSDRPEHDQLRRNSITRKSLENVGYNKAIDRLLATLSRVEAAARRETLDAIHKSCGVALYQRMSAEVAKHPQDGLSAMEAANVAKDLIRASVRFLRDGVTLTSPAEAK